MTSNDVLDDGRSAPLRRRMQIYSFSKIKISDEIDDFMDCVKRKNCTQNHKSKIINYSKKLSKSITFYCYDEIKNIGIEKRECYYSAIRTLSKYFLAKYRNDEQLIKEINFINKQYPKPHSNPDIYTPSDEELKQTLINLKELSEKYYQFYLGLICSGVRIRELIHYFNNQKSFRVVEFEKFNKIVLNYRRGKKNIYFLYLPKDYDISMELTNGALTRWLSNHKEILRPKYIRKWFYSKCLDLGIPSGVVDFFQGRSPVTMGNRHYLDKEKMADKVYVKIVDFVDEFV